MANNSSTLPYKRQPGNSSLTSFSRAAQRRFYCHCPVSPDTLLRIARLHASGIHLSTSQTNSTATSTGSLSSFRWSDLSPQQRNSLLAAGLSWLFSGFAVMLYSAMLPQLMSALSMNKSTAGMLNALMLVATGLGSYLFGTFADRIGTQARSDLLHSHLYHVYFLVRLGDQCCHPLPSADSRLVWVWAGNGPVALLWLPSRGPPIGARAPSASCRAAMPSATRWRSLRSASFSSVTWRGVFFFGLLPAFFMFWLRNNVRSPRSGKHSLSNLR